ncbi:hypothetical protein FXO37_01897 [Capsicum annuum]|nr:hypothetical protein FXO37_01897 [Capsicum annuum]
MPKLSQPHFPHLIFHQSHSHLLSNNLIFNSVSPGKSTHPSQPPHLCHLDVGVLKCPILRSILHSWSNCHSAEELTFKLRRHLPITQELSERPLQLPCTNTVCVILVNLSIPLYYRPKILENIPLPEWPVNPAPLPHQPHASNHWTCISTPGKQAGVGVLLPLFSINFPSVPPFCQVKTREVYELQGLQGPAFGTRGKIVLPFEDNPSSKIGVRFDKPIPDGVNFGGLCDDGHGFFCKASELRLEASGADDLDKLLISTLFEVVFSESRNSPFILFMKDAEKSMAGSSESYSTFKNRLEKLPANIVVLGSHAHTDNRKEKSHPGGLLFTKFGSNQTALLDLAFPDSFGKLHDRGKEVTKTTKLLTKLFPNKVTIHMPQDEALLSAWKQQLDRDADTLKMKGNLNSLRTIQASLDFDGVVHFPPHEFCFWLYKASQELPHPKVEGGANEDAAMNV